jgi:hypothetical protein
MAYIQNNPFSNASCGCGSPLKKKGDAPSRKKSLGYYAEVKKGGGEGASAGGGMTSAGVKKYRKDNPGSKLKTAVTKCDVKVGTAAYKRQKNFCSRSRSWTGVRVKSNRYKKIS